MSQPVAAAPAAYRGAASAAPAGVTAGLSSADIDAAGDEVVVFLIGMRVNRWRAVRSWAWVARQMPAMLISLARLPDSPLLAAQTWVSGRSVMTLQYWRSAEELGRFARDPEHPHASAWREFNRRVAATADVGIWHETYTVAADQVETLYANLPPLGLARAFGQVPAGTRRRTTAVDRVHGAAGDHELGATVGVDAHGSGGALPA